MKHINSYHVFENIGSPSFTEHSWEDNDQKRRRNGPEELEDSEIRELCDIFDKYHMHNWKQLYCIYMAESKGLSIRIDKSGDEWFYVSVDMSQEVSSKISKILGHEYNINSFQLGFVGIRYFECDQMSGLMEFLEMILSGNFTNNFKLKCHFKVK